MSKLMSTPKLLRFSGEDYNILKVTVTPSGDGKTDKMEFRSKDEGVHLLVRDRSAPNDEQHEVVVSGRYGVFSGSGWTIALSPALSGSEKTSSPPPNWVVYFTRGDRSGSPCLVMVVPDSVEVTEIYADDYEKSADKGDEADGMKALREDNERLRLDIRLMKSMMAETNARVQRLVDGSLSVVPR